MQTVETLVGLWQTTGWACSGRSWAFWWLIWVCSHGIWSTRSLQRGPCPPNTLLLQWVSSNGGMLLQRQLLVKMLLRRSFKRLQLHSSKARTLCLNKGQVCSIMLLPVLSGLGTFSWRSQSVCPGRLGARVGRPWWSCSF